MQTGKESRDRERKEDIKTIKMCHAHVYVYVLNTMDVFVMYCKHAVRKKEREKEKYM